jgi:transcriptional regulator with XRE-family HTH domain
MNSGVNTEMTSLLRDMIGRSGLTSRDLGARLGLSTTMLSFIVQGKRHPSRDTLIALAYECGYERRELDRALRLAGYPALLATGPASLSLTQVKTAGAEALPLPQGNALAEGIKIDYTVGQSNSLSSLKSRNSRPHRRKNKQLAFR